MKLPPIFYSTDKGTWLATRKPQKTQSKANRQLETQTFQRTEAGAGKDDTQTPPPSAFRLNSTNCYKATENPLSKWLLRNEPSTPVENTSLDQATKSDRMSSHLPKSSLRDDWLANDTPRKQSRDLDAWLLKPKSTGVYCDQAFRNTWLSTGHNPTIQDTDSLKSKWLSRPDRSAVECLDSLTLEKGETMSALNQWISGDSVSEGSIITVDEIDELEDFIEDGELIDKSELEMW